MSDESGPDAKVLGVASHDVRKSGIRDLADVPRHLLNEIGHFFDIYKELEPGKSTDIRGWMDRAEAERVIAEAGERAAAVASGPVPEQRADAAGDSRPHLRTRTSRVLSVRNTN
jgi:inorganic pyrophosphatase